MPELLTPLEVSEELGVTRRWVTELLNRGELKGMKLGPKHWAIAREDLEVFKAEQTKKNPTATKMTV